MARVKRGTTAHARHKKILGLAKGFRGRSSTNYRMALQRVEKSLRYAYRDRRNRKRDFGRPMTLKDPDAKRAAKLLGGYEG